MSQDKEEDWDLTEEDEEDEEDYSPGMPSA
jgi:hypothetical protein